MRKLLVSVLALSLGWAASAQAQLSIGIGMPSLSIGIDVPLYPQLVQVPGYPAYYAPNLSANYFFYDGGYWVYQDDTWYTSAWYNGPWSRVEPELMPLFVLRIPLRYYRHPPSYFLGWRDDAPPRWGEHWGNDWQQHRRGWDQWDRSAAPAPAPLPSYQGRYSGVRYPPPEQQHELQRQNYRYQPRDPAAGAHVAQPATQAAPPQANRPPPPEAQRARAPATEPPRRQATQPDRAAAPAATVAATQRTAPPQRSEPHQSPPPDKAKAQEPQRNRGDERGNPKDEERGAERNKN